MNTFITVGAGILIFSIVVLVHEFGHYWMARRAGIKIEEFGIGIPPRLWGLKRNGMIWSINWIPFGGFVRMLGEDANDPKAAKSKNSFLNKTLRQKILVVIFGVVMNLGFAFLLLTIGFSVGMQPLIVNIDDFIGNLKQGNIVLESGMRVKSVTDGSMAAKAGLLSGDVLKKWDNEEKSDSDFWEKLFSSTVKDQHILSVQRGGADLLLNISGSGQLGATLYNPVTIPAVVVSNVKFNSGSEAAGLRENDIILSMNGKKIFTIADYQESLNGSGGTVVYGILRRGTEMEVKVDLIRKNQVIITDIIPGSAAEKVLLQKGDVIWMINGEKVFLPQRVIEIVKANINKPVNYEVIRDRQLKSFQIVIPETGVIGIYMTEIIPYEINELSVYGSSLLASIVKVKDVKYPIYSAPIKVFGEIKRLSIFTVTMFGSVIGNIVSTRTVPEGVSGPVGIARLASGFIKEGLTSTIRFIALLSLSLGVINIIPIPALDGGRLAFLIAEGIRGKKIKPEVEGKIHMIGFILMMILIVFVTYNDILQAIYS